MPPTASSSGSGSGACWILACPMVIHGERSQTASVPAPGKLLSGRKCFPSQLLPLPAPSTSRQEPAAGRLLAGCSLLLAGQSCDQLCRENCSCPCWELDFCLQIVPLGKEADNCPAQQLLGRLCHCREQLLQLLEAAPRAEALCLPWEVWGHFPPVSCLLLSCLEWLSSLLCQEPEWDSTDTNPPRCPPPGAL